MGDPAAAAALAARLSTAGVAWIDCAVSGGPAGARAGTLTAMVGGDAGVLAGAEPLLGTFAKRIVHCGGPGAGHAVKAVNNTLLAANIWTAAEGLVLLERMGIDPAVALSAINGSSGRSWVTEQRFVDHVLPRGFDYGFALGLLAKDVQTAMRMADGEADSSAGNRVPMPVLRAVREMVQVARSELGPGADHTEMVRVLERWAGGGAELRQGGGTLGQQAEEAVRKEK